MMEFDNALLDWLLKADPALRWQVERDVAGASTAEWEATRARIATEGFGARLLSLQGTDGQWAGGAYFPNDFDFDGPEAEADGQPWTATTWSLNTLRDWGLDADALADTAELLARTSRWEYNNRPFWEGEVDCCINSFTLANGAWLGADVSALVPWFAEHQLDDGGWNCEWVNGSVRSSFHSTLNVLQGLLYYEIASPESARRTLRRAGEKYLLERRLLNCRSSGEPVGPWVSEIAYPFRWPYNVLRALDYFRAASLHDETAPDERLSDAVELVRAARHENGYWIQGAPHAGREWFAVDVPQGEPSKWLTFFSARILSWWDESHSGPT